jgi:hypothetical protein
MWRAFATAELEDEAEGARERRRQIERDRLDVSRRSPCRLSSQLDGEFHA